MTPPSHPDAERPGVSASPVTDEAVRLIEALAGFASGRSGSHRDTGARPADGRSASAGAGAHRQDAAAQPGCACSSASTIEAVCRMCPVCRVAGMVHAIQPETMDHLADLLSMIAGSLQAAAADRRTDPTAPRHAADRPTGRSEYHDEVVPVTDEPSRDPSRDDPRG